MGRPRLARLWRRRFAHAEIPCGVDRQRRVVRHGADASGPLRLGHRPAVIGAPYRRLERALELLLVLLRRHVAARGFKLLLRQDAGLRRREQRRVPALVRAGRAVFAPELVVSLGRADEDRPPLAVGERRADHLAPEMRAHLGVFVEHRAVEIDAAQRVRVVGAVELDARPVGQVDAELGLVGRQRIDPGIGDADARRAGRADQVGDRCRRAVERVARDRRARPVSERFQGALQWRRGQGRPAVLPSGRFVRLRARQREGAAAAVLVERRFERGRRQAERPFEEPELDPARGEPVETFCAGTRKPLAILPHMRYLLLISDLLIFLYMKNCVNRRSL